MGAAQDFKKEDVDKGRQKSRPESALQELPAGKSPRRIPMCMLAGLTMQLDFTHQTQRWVGLQERELYGWIRRLSAGIQHRCRCRRE